jgi:hypothetical protein
VRLDFDSRGGLPPLVSGTAARLPRVPRWPATESPRFRPGAACVLHLLLTLSDRFIIALCTNPPKPFVGEGGLSDIALLWAGRPSGARASSSSEVLDSEGMSVGELEKGIADRLMPALE